MALAIALAAALLAAAAGTSRADTPTPLGCVSDPRADSTFQHCPVDAAGLNGAIGAVVSPDGHNLYVTSELAGELTTFDRDTSSGAIRQAACFKPSDWSSTLDAPSDCTQAANGINGAIGLAISPDGKSVYAAGDVDHAVAAFARDGTTGALTEVGCVEYLTPAAGRDVCSDRGDGLSGARTVAVSPDGKNVYVGTANHTIAEFARDAATGALRQLPAPDNCIEDPADNNSASGIVNGGGKANCSRTASGLAYVRTVTVSPDGRNVYAATDYGQAVSQFARDPSTGALTPLGCVSDPSAPSYTSCSTDVPGLGWAFGIVVSPDGRFAYASANGVITILSRDSDGRLHQAGCVSQTAPVGGCATAYGITDVVALTLSPDGGTLYAAAFRGGDFAMFKRDETSGMLDELGCVQSEKLPAGDPHCSTNADGIYQPRVVAPSPDGFSLYVTTSVGSDVAGFGLPRPAPSPPAPPPAPPEPAVSARATRTTISVVRAKSPRRVSQATANRRFRVRGKVYGASGGSVVLELGRKTRRGWKPKRRLSRSIAGNGTFSTVTRIARRGKWRVRAIYRGGSGTLPSTSRYVKFPRVRSQARHAK